MTGAYMTWTYGPAGWVVDLNEYIKDPKKTNRISPGMTSCRAALLHRLERRLRRRARVRGCQAMVHSVGL